MLLGRGVWVTLLAIVPCISLSEGNAIAAAEAPLEERGAFFALRSELSEHQHGGPTVGYQRALLQENSPLRAPNGSQSFSGYRAQSGGSLMATSAAVPSELHQKERVLAGAPRLSGPVLESSLTANGTVCVKANVTGGMISIIDGTNCAMSGSLAQLMKELLQNDLSRLTQLLLSGNSLSGPIPPEVCELSELVTLDLAFNALSGPIPAALGNLGQLSVLYLGYNALSGRIPESLGRLSRLTMLDLSINQLQGPIPSSLGTLSSLTYFGMFFNLLTGEIPSALGSLQNVSTLDLRFNQLSGAIPDALGSMTALNTLWLGSNELSGSIPTSLGRLLSLAYLDLSANMLTGIVPAELGLLTSLRALDLHQNQLMGSVPSALGNCTALQTLDLSRNLLTGAVPSFLGKLSQATTILLGSNLLTGSIPTELGTLSSLQKLGLSKNQLLGPLPASLNSLSALTSLDVSGNQLNGSVSLAGCGNLSTLLLQNNSLSALPALPPSLTSLDVSNNPLQGPFPQGVLQSSLVELRLQNCSLQGSLPARLASLASLSTLDLRGNPQLGQAFPDISAGSLTNLFAANCSFTSVGALPATIAIVDFTANLLSAVPNNLPSLFSLTELWLAGNQISQWPRYGAFARSVVSFEGSDFQSYTAGATALAIPLSSTVITTIDLSNNPLACDAREVLASVAYLTSLRYFSCENCQLKGDIPSFMWPNYNGFFAGVAFPGTGYFGLQKGFSTLLKLKLAKNNLTRLPPEPPSLLQLADLSSNQLTVGPKSLPRAWLNEGGSYSLTRLVLQSNPDLRFTVAAPQAGNDGGCVNVQGLTAKANSFEPFPNKTFECSALCSLGSMSYVVDVVDPADMCRCVDGYSGQATSCSACPADTFSTSDPTDLFRMVKVCTSCPARSSTQDLTKQSSLCSCKCPRGSYLSAGEQCRDVVNATCIACGALKTTSKTGSLSPQDCTCNTSITGLFQAQDANASCRCLEGFYLDWTGPACRECSVGQDCAWEKSSRGDYLDPPRVVAGYWAKTGGAPRTNFSGHSVFRCYSQFTCIDNNGICAAGRTGPMCSLCQPGHFGGPNGACRPCPASQSDSRQQLGLGMMLIWPLALALHIINELMEGTTAAQITPKTPTTIHEAWRCLRWLFVGLGHADAEAEDCDAAGEDSNPVPSQQGAAGLRGSITRGGTQTGLRGSLMVNGLTGLRGSMRHSIVGLAGPQMIGQLRGSQRGQSFGGSFADDDEIDQEEQDDQQQYRQIWMAGCICTIFQLFQHVQLVSVVTKVETSLPPMIKETLQSASKGTTAIFDVWGVACLVNEQTAALELGFRWVFPFGAIVMAFLARPFAIVTGALANGLGSLRCWSKLRCPGRRRGRVEGQHFVPAFLKHFAKMCNAMDGFAILKVVAVACSQYFLNILVSNGMLLFTCIANPNGRYTVHSFPHIQCPTRQTGFWSPDTEEFMLLFGPCMAYCFVFVILLPLGVNVVVFRKVVRELVNSGLKHRGPWGVFCPDFRNSHVHWLLVIVFKDLLINIVTTVMVAQRAMRLLFIAGAAGIYAWFTSREQPWLNFMNNMIEVWLGQCLAATAFLLVATDVANNGLAGTIEAPVSDIMLITVQVLAIGGPVLMLAAQGLGAFPLTARVSPKALHPLTSQRRIEDTEEMANAIKDAGGPAEVLGQMDDVDFALVVGHLRSCAALCALLPESTQVNPTISSLRSSLRRRNARILTHNATEVPKGRERAGSDEESPGPSSRDVVTEAASASSTKRAKPQVLGRAGSSDNGFDHVLPGAVMETSQ